MTDFKPKAIIFDLLTGLINSWDIWDACIPESEKSISSGTKWRQQYLKITFSCGSYVPYSDLVQQAAKDVGLSPAVAETLLQRYDEIGNNPWPEVAGVLAKLKAKEYKLAVVTNISKDLGHRTVNNLERIVRQETEAKDFVFDDVITAEESGYYKPHPEAYLAMLKKLDMKPEEVLFLAGSAGDVVGASKVGMKVCWNNHIRMSRQGETEPLKEGKALDEALDDFIRE